MFNEPKAVRLAFHDCMPYEDGGGCDGCLNFEANEDEHNVLQHTVAILVMQFTHKFIMIWYIITLCLKFRRKCIWKRTFQV